jgi:ABC-type transport system substrate-binding protein
MCAGGLLKNMRIFLKISLIIAIFGIWRPCPCQLSMPDTSTIQLDSARIIHQVGPRIYIDKGLNSGIDNSWRISINVGDEQTIDIQLHWCGEDISYFINPDSAGYAIESGQTFHLIPGPSGEMHKRKITIAYSSNPARPHQGAKSLSDREFRDLLTISLNDAADYFQLSADLRGDRNRSVNEFFTIQLRDTLYFSDGSPIGKDDIIYSLLYFIHNPTPETYALEYLKSAADDVKISSTHPKNLTISSPLGQGHLQLIMSSADIPLMKAPREMPDEVLSLHTPDSSGQLDSTAYDKPQYAISSGPYYLAHSSAERILLIRNRLHARALEYPDTILIKIIPDYLKQKLAFQLGQIDILDINYSDLDNFKGKYRVAETLLQEIAVLSSNTQKSYMQDGIINAALGYLINKESLCRVALGGTAEPWDLFRPVWSKPLTPAYQYHPSSGKALLKNATDLPQYISLYVNPDDFISRRSAEYIKGLLERENLYVTIYSRPEEESSADTGFIEQFDLMLSRIDISSDNPIHLLSQMGLMPELEDPLSNRSLYYSENHKRIIQSYLESDDSHYQLLERYYHILTETPWGVVMFQPRRQLVLGNHIREFRFTSRGFIDFSGIEIQHESER